MVAAVFVVPEQAAVFPAVADEDDGEGKDEAADGAGLSLEEESGEIKDHQDRMVVQEGRVDGLGNQQHRNQPLEAVHSTDNFDAPAAPLGHYHWLVGASS